MFCFQVIPRFQQGETFQPKSIEVCKLDSNFSEGMFYNNLYTKELYCIAFELKLKLKMYLFNLFQIQYNF